MISRAKLAFAAIAVLLCPAAIRAAEPETLETVLAVWRKREAATVSVKVVMSEESFSAPIAGLEGEPIAGGSVKRQRVLTIDGTKMRHERVGELIVQGQDTPDLWTWIAVIDGQRAKDLSKVDRDDTMIHSSGGIQNREKHIDIHNITLFPVLWHWRAFSPPLGVFNVGSLKVISTDEKIAGSRCILLHEAYGDRGAIRKYWIDPDKDMAVVRMVATNADALLHQVDTTFRHDVKLGWVPEKWKASRYARGRGLYSSDADTVTELKVNLDVPPEMFDIEFPPGTEVWDAVAKTKIVIPAKK